MCVSDNSEPRKSETKTEETLFVPKRAKLSDLAPPSLPNIGLCTRPVSIVSTTTSDEGGFNEPSPKIEAKLKPHEESIYDFPVNEDKPCEYTDSPEDINEYKECKISQYSPTKLTPAEIEALYAVPHKKPSQSHNSVPDVAQYAEPRKHHVAIVSGNQEEDEDDDMVHYAVPYRSHSISQQKSVTSTDSDVSQVTVIPQRSFDSDVMYHDQSKSIKQTVLSELESQDSFEKSCQKDIVVSTSCSSSSSRLSAIKSSSSASANSGSISSASTADARKSEPFLIAREILQTTTTTVASARTQNFQKSEANILDLNDVEYADASDNEQNSCLGDKKVVPEADAMTPDEAEHLLSNK